MVPQSQIQILCHGTTEPPKLEPNYPYFLGFQDSPGNIITNIKLCEENYEEWSRSFRLALHARRKHSFVDCTITKSKTSSELEDWYTVHSMIVFWIMRTIEPATASTISYYEDAKLLWDDLKERFIIVNGPRIQQLKAAIFDWKQQKKSICCGLLWPIKISFGCSWNL